MLEQRLAEFLAANQILTLATTRSSLIPWIAAAYFAEDGPYELQLMIDGRGRTFANIQSNPHVAVMVGTGDALGVFAQAEGRGMFVPDAAERFRERLTVKAPACAPLVAIPNLVPVKIVVDRWLITHVNAGWIPSRELRRQREVTAQLHGA